MGTLDDLVCLLARLPDDVDTLDRSPFASAIRPLLRRAHDRFELTSQKKPGIEYPWPGPTTSRTADGPCSRAEREHATVDGRGAR